MKHWLRPSFFFVLGIMGLSWSIAAFRGLWETPSMPRFAVLMLCLSLFLWAMFMMGYYTYVRERAKGNVAIPIKMYERILKNRGVA